MAGRDQQFVGLGGRKEAGVVDHALNVRPHFRQGQDPSRLAVAHLVRQRVEQPLIPDPLRDIEIREGVIENGGPLRRGERVEEERQVPVVVAQPGGDRDAVLRRESPRVSQQPAGEARQVSPAIGEHGRGAVGVVADQRPDGVFDAAGEVGRRFGFEHREDGAGVVPDQARQRRVRPAPPVLAHRRRRAREPPAQVLEDEAGMPLGQRGQVRDQVGEVREVCRHGRRGGGGEQAGALGVGEIEAEQGVDGIDAALDRQPTHQEAAIGGGGHGILRGDLIDCVGERQSCPGGSRHARVWVPGVSANEGHVPVGAGGDQREDRVIIALGRKRIEQCCQFPVVAVRPREGDHPLTSRGVGLPVEIAEQGGQVRQRHTDDRGMQSGAGSGGR